MDLREPDSCYVYASLQAKDRRTGPTLAEKLGDIPHVSGLAIRLARASGAGQGLSEWLLKVAVARGAGHYERQFDSTLPPDNPAIRDEEIGVALCLEEHAYSLEQLRVAAQFLSSSRIDLDHLCRLAVQERCEPVLLHIAEIAKKYAPEQQPWAALRERLPPRRVPKTEALPHWTRLVSHSAITREGRERTDWLVRRE